jgi:hypothetical protein
MAAICNRYYRCYADNRLPIAKGCYIVAITFVRLFCKETAKRDSKMFSMRDDYRGIYVQFLISRCLTLNLLVTCLNSSKTLVIYQVQLDR